jgi:hypothetical protein
MVDSIAVSLVLFASALPRIPVTGAFRLPPGVIELSSELQVPEDAHDLEISGPPEGATLLAAAGFQGRALLNLRGGRNIRIRNVDFDGNRARVAKPAGLPPYDAPFIRFTRANAIAAESVDGLTVENCRFREIAGFAVLAASSKKVRIEKIAVTASGSRNEKGRNNTTGGVLLEEGASDFAVLRSSFRGIEGNGIWTHSLYTSPRNGPGAIFQNEFDTIGRDAIQVGHATQVQVEGNRGVKIGYPVGIVDVEGGGTPVGIDTAGNVDLSSYNSNRFEEINGKCIDLDGFHSGEVRANVCINRGRPEDYAFGHFAIVFNNSNPDMRSERVRVVENEIDGAKFGGIFVIGTGHIIAHNRLRRLNLAGCTENAAKFGCYYGDGEPDMLRSGIYLGKRAERPAPARGNTVEGNVISGHMMKTRCVAAAPGIAAGDNIVRNNSCEDSK